MRKQPKSSKPLEKSPAKQEEGRKCQAYRAAVLYHCADAYQAVLLNSAAAQRGAVADGHVAADNGWVAICAKGADACAVLHVAALTNAHGLQVACRQDKCNSFAL